jgi:hypothetical protein
MICADITYITREKSDIPLHIIHVIELLDRIEVGRDNTQMPWCADLKNYLAAGVFSLEQTSQ